MKRISVFDPLARGLAHLAAPAAAFAALALLAAPVAAVSAPDPNDPHGVWLRPEGGEQFSFYDCGALLCAKLISVKKPEDEKAIGTVILRGAAKSGPNEWKGKLYNAKDGKTYDGFITIKSANELRLKGCLWGFLCSGETWTRVAAAKAQSAAAAPAHGKESARAE
ncbi:DUF2147 domain-containing protein [Methylocystis sp. JAN1]|uniref:DUF2147 domain-containing protein n=1 Tax=Methylocystis sp. JAN1 TaxID=3397211 RepID=UPI003FA1C964